MPSVRGDDDTIGYGVYGESRYPPLPPNTNIPLRDALPRRFLDCGVQGYSVLGDGVKGESKFGSAVFGESVNSAGVRGYGPRDAGVVGSGGWLSPDGNDGKDGDGVRGYSGNGIGLNGISGTNDGVHGISITGDGVHGESGGSAGVRGVGRQYGLYGKSDDGEGVRGESRTTYGIRGISFGHFGVRGSSFWRDGVSGDSTAGSGVSGSSTYGKGVYGESFGSGDGVRGISDSGNGLYGKSNSGNAAHLDGNVIITGSLQKGGGSFKIDHPLDPTNKYLYHSFVESPDMKNVYDGVVALDDKGEAQIELPDWFDALNKDFRYQLTAIGTPGPNLYIAEEIISDATITKHGSQEDDNNRKNNGNRFKIAGGTSGMKVSWQVTGIRKDPWANAHRVQVEEEKSDKEKGYYMYPDLYGKPVENGISRLLFPEKEKQKWVTIENRLNL